MTTIENLRPVVAAYLARCEWTPDGCLINPRLRDGHYGEVSVGARRMAAHRAVAAVQAGVMPDLDAVARHSCDNKRCANPDHIRFGTQSQNVTEGYERGRREQGWPRGEGRPHAILTEAIVCEMRRLARSGASLGAIVAQFGIGYSPTRMAIRGETWAHVTSEAPVPGRTNRKPNPRAYRFTRTKEAAQVAELIRGGLSLAEVAKQLGISRHTAWRLSQVAKEAVGVKASERAA